MVSSTLPLLLALIGLSYGMVEVGPVRLANRHLYVKYDETNSLLECPYTALDEEEVALVYWRALDGDEEVGAFTWSPEGERLATGILEGRVNLEREDGNLELTELDYELSRPYLCGVTTTDEATWEAAPWEVLIVDETGSEIVPEIGFEYDTCLVAVSVDLYPVFPPPTVHAGIFSQSMGGFYHEAQNWETHVYENKSVKMSLTKEMFLIDPNIPSDSMLLVTVGVTKADRSYISLQLFTYRNDTLVRPGCPAVNTRAYQVAQYSSDVVSCRGKYLPHADEALTAKVTCEKGHKAQGPVDHAILECDLTQGKWVTSQGQPSHREFQCVIENSASLAAPVVTSLLVPLVMLLR